MTPTTPEHRRLTAAAILPVSRAIQGLCNQVARGELDGELTAVLLEAGAAQAETFPDDLPETARAQVRVICAPLRALATSCRVIQQNIDDARDQLRKAGEN